MKPTCSFRQCAIWRSLSSRRLWPNTRISPPVALSMAAIRCNSVDLPEPEGPISATNSPLWIWMSMFLSAQGTAVAVVGIFRLHQHQFFYQHGADRGLDQFRAGGPFSR